MSLTSRTATFHPAGPLRGELTAPADKAVSHRAAIFAAMSEQPVHVTNYLDAADTNSTLEAVRRLGATVTPGAAPGEYVIAGVGLDGPRELDAPIDVGNSGTLLRFLPGWLGGQVGRRWTLDGDESIRRRPIDRIRVPLEQMGADLRARDGRLAPFDVVGRPLHGITYALPVASAQVKSCVLIAGMVAAGETAVVEPAPSRDHTERLLTRAGVALRRAGDTITVTRPARFGLDAVRVPGDPSSAAFHVAAALLVPGSRIVVRDMAANWGRVGFYSILRRMGAELGGELETPATASPDSEPVIDLEVVAGGLRGTTVEADEVPLAIDELPLVALLGCFAEGETVVRGARELRVKETDRIATVVEGLQAQGARIEATDDGFVVQGTGGLPGGGVMRSHGDHRLAMLGAVAGLASRDGVTVDGMDAAVVSYPGFEADLAGLTR
jgi:3-phosphoshikimate 1-carboxyvinyltransferase